MKNVSFVLFCLLLDLDIFMKLPHTPKLALTKYFNNIMEFLNRDNERKRPQFCDRVILNDLTLNENNISWK